MKEALNWGIIIVAFALIEWLFFGLNQLESTIIQWGFILIPIGIIRLGFIVYNKSK